MKQRPRIYYTEEQKALMWERWQQGDTLHSITRFLTAITRRSKVFWQTGGIRPAPR